MKTRLLILWMVLFTGFGSAKPGETAAVEGPSRTEVLAARATPARRILLTNGMVILLKESPAHDLIAVEMLCQVGLANEQTPTAGLIALWSRIMKERLDDATEDNYRIVDKSVSIEPDFLRISIQGPATDGEDMITALSELVKNDVYDDKVVSRHRKKLVKDIKAGRAGAKNQLYSIFRSLFYRHHTYRRQHTSGTLAIERIDSKVLTEFHRRYLVSDRLVLAACGRLSRTTLDDLTRKLFSPLKSRNEPDFSVAWEPKATEKRIDLGTRSNIAWVLVGYPAPSAGSEDHIPMKLIDTILSQGLSSRLFSEIREKKGLAYTVSGLHPDLKGPSHFLTYVITRPHDAGRVRRDVLKQAERLQKEPLSAAELESAKRKLRGGFLTDRETNRGTAFRLAKAESIGLGYGYEENFEKKLTEVTSEDIRRVAKEYLVNPTVIIARPAGKLYWDG
jgi:zinc protease